MKTDNHPISARLLALAVAVLVSVSAGGFSQILYLCSMTGEVGQRCCCPHEAQAPTQHAAALFAVPCCEPVKAGLELQTARAEVISPKIERTTGILIITAEPDLVVFKPTDRILPRQSRGPPPDTGPPLFIKHCSYLI